VYEIINETKIINCIKHKDIMRERAHERNRAWHIYVIEKEREQHRDTRWQRSWWRDGREIRRRQLDEKEKKAKRCKRDGEKKREMWDRRERGIKRMERKRERDRGDCEEKRDEGDIMEIMNVRGR
jgi:hypothetical protein